MSDRENNSRAFLSRQRAQALQPFIHATDTVLFYAGQGCSNVPELKAARKILLDPIVAVPPGVEVVRNLSEFSGIDVVTCDHVLEYLLDPRERLLQFKAILKPGGRLIAVALYDEAFRRPNLKKPAERFYSWNVQTLGNLLVDCGYEFHSGTVKRYPNEEFVCRYAKKVGLRFAVVLAKFFAPAFEVFVVAKRP
jgi:SAM-dependent methyltransferase